MSKRKRTENDVEVADEFIKDLEDLDDEAARRFKEKHSLDSDEEDDNTGKYEIMHEDDIEGFEKSRNFIMSINYNVFYTFLNL